MGVEVNREGMLFASIVNVGASLMLCNVSASYGGWLPTARRAVQASLLAAELGGRQVAVYLADGQACSQASWTDLTTKGFYHAAMY